MSEAPVRQGHAADLGEVPRKLQYDFYYIKNLFFWLDLQILVSTARMGAGQVRGGLTGGGIAMDRRGSFGGAYPTAMHFSRRSLLGTTFGLSVAAAARGWPADAQPTPSGSAVTPEMFGAKGDGVTNDSAAFARLAAHVNARGGGEVLFRRATYIVGRQTQAFRSRSPLSFAPDKLLEFVGCTRPLVIRGNGARLKCAPGLRYGTFDPVTGQVTRHAMPYTAHGEIASPYDAMLKVQGCSGPIWISDLELDGNLQGLSVGGEFGDRGRQIPAVGLALYDNEGSEEISNIHAHHHALDGLAISGVDRASPRDVKRTLVNVRSEYNGRQGCSITGGRGYAFTSCKFNHTGRAGIATSPGAGLDIEAEGKKNRDFTFNDCEFSNNFGVGMVADTGDSEGALFRRCTFIGTTAWSAWPYKPRFAFDDCTFVGAVVRAHPDPDPRRAAKFTNCRFRDDPRLSPTGKVYLAGEKNHAIVDLADSQNVSFNRCSFLLTHDGLLPWSWRAHYADCVMSQAAVVPAAAQTNPKGKYFGRSTIRAPGKLNLYGTMVVGSLIVNGVPMPKGSLGGDPW